MYLRNGEDLFTNMQQLISIIVPIYNVEQYLDKCVKSIQNQTYQNLEIILVDDGSPDHCGAMCDEYAQSDKRIRVIHKKNGGLADARNHGLDIARGDYIAFVDSDDYIHPQMYESMLRAAVDNEADIVISDWKKVNQEENHLLENMIPDEKRLQAVDGKKIQYLYFDKPDSRITYTVAWNKLYTKEIFTGRRFPVGKVHEDEFVTFQILYDAKKIIYLPEELYFYLVRDVSIMGKFNMKRFDIFDAYAEKLNFFSSKGEKVLAGKTFFMAAHMLVQYSEWIDRKDPNALETYKKYYRMWKENSKKYREDIISSSTQKLEIMIFNHFFQLYRLMWKIKHLLKNNAMRRK